MEFAFASMGPTLRWLALIIIFIGVLAALGITYLLASLPGKLARNNNHPQAEAINICGWLGLPSGIIWVAALVWAYLKSSPGQETDAVTMANQIKALEDMVSLLEANEAKPAGGQP